MIFVTVHTSTRNPQGKSTREERNVTLAYSPAHPEQGITLLGNLEHSTQIVVNQKLVDDLQYLVNLQAETEVRS